MNELTTRSIDTVTTEIITLTKQAQSMALSYAVEIGARLAEAKGMLPHGEWGDWLKNKVNYSQRSASNFMRIYEAYGTGQLSLNDSNRKPDADLSVTQALLLLAVPSEEREEFIEQNNVRDMSKRELEQAIKERNEALKKAEEADRLTEQLENARAKAEREERAAAMSEQKVRELDSQISALNSQLEKAQESEKKAKSQLKELKANPHIPQELVDKLKEESQAEAQEKLSEKIKSETDGLRSELEEAQKAKAQAEAAAQAARDKTAELEKKLRMSDPTVAEFKRLFGEAQSILGKLIEQLESVKRHDSELAVNFSRAVSDMLNQYRA